MYNDARNILRLEINEILADRLNSELMYKIKDKIKALIDLERKEVKNLQLVDVKALHVRAGDLIFDYVSKRVEKIHYAEMRNKCQYNIGKDNNEMLFSYGEDRPCDYIDADSNVLILLNIAEVDSVFEREDLELEDDN